MNALIKNYLGKIFQAYLTVIIILIVVDVLLLSILTIYQIPFLEFFSMASSTIVKIYQLDLLVSILLFLNFLLFLLATGDRSEFMRKFWVLIPASIPFDYLSLSLMGMDFTLLLLLLRLVHIAALIKSIGRLGSAFIVFTQRTGLNYGIALFTIFFLVVSTGFLLVEKEVNPQVDNYEDAAWYTIVSITTTGYGDIVPVTSLGRIFGTLMMVGGLAFTGYATASIASLLIDRFQKERDEDRKTVIKLSEKFNQERRKDYQDIKDSLHEILERMDEKK